MKSLKGRTVKKFLATSIAAALLISTAAQAGGPVIVEEESEVVAEKSGSSMGILPIIIIGVALCAALCGSDDNDNQPPS